MSNNQYISNDFQHKAVINVLGWGEPPQYHPSCSCGWIGVNIDTFPNNETNFYSFLKPLIDKYGLEQLARLPHSASGVEKDAIKQVLIHINYNPDFEAERTLSIFNELFAQYTKYINEGKFRQSFELANNLQKAHEEILITEERTNIFKNHELNIPEFDPEIYKEIQQKIDDNRKMNNE